MKKYIDQIILKTNASENVILNAIKEAYYHESSFFMTSDERKCEIYFTKNLNEFAAVIGENQFLTFTTTPEIISEIENFKPNKSFSIVEKVVKKLRIHQLVKNLKASKTPMEAYDLITDFLGDDYEGGSYLNHKNIRIQYEFVYNKENEQIDFSVNLTNKTTKDPIMSFEFHFTRKNVKQTFEAIESIAKLYR